MDRSTQYELAIVSEETKQAREAQQQRRDRWSWVEAAVWTDRMLAALEAGVKGGQWFSLMDKVYSRRNLEGAWARVKANDGAAGVDQVTVAMFDRQRERNVERLAEQLSEGSYRPQAVKRVWIPKPGSKEERPLGIPTVADRVVQTAVRQVIEPIFERDFAEHSYGFRPKRGAKNALRRVQHLLEQGYQWVVDADLKSYFDTIPKDRLLRLVEEKISDGRVLGLIRAFVNQGVLEDMKYWTPEAGTPQGAVISPLLSNIYLNPLDQKMAQQKHQMVRYADDFVILCQSQSEADQALQLVRDWTEAAGLQLHPDKTRIVDATLAGGFDFLGYHFERGLRWPRKKSIQKLKDKVRAFTHRKNGHSLSVIIANLNRTLRGWFEYFQHSHRPTFSTLDGWIRMRLRSVLRKRAGRRGRGHGADHHRYPNAFFAEHGLFSLLAAHASVRANPSTR